MKTTTNLNTQAPESKFPALYLCKSTENIWLVTSPNTGTCVVANSVIRRVGDYSTNLEINDPTLMWRRLDPSESVILQND